MYQFPKYVFCATALFVILSLNAEAIRTFYKEEVSRLEKLSKETDKQLNEAAKKTQPLAALVPLAMQQVIPFEEFKKLGE